MNFVDNSFQDAGLCFISDVPVLLIETLDSLLSLPKNLWVEVRQSIVNIVQDLKAWFKLTNDLISKIVLILAHMLSASKDVISAIGQDENNSFNKFLNNSAKCLEQLRKK
ncbi:hypothetical protein CRE_09507 [Caenorhabditis remanei]|uniref:Uncharacterized protein n=1 Tax=Caenorhabditis remanei TaxID=31234 RepID=E3MIZ3_CAERE|nr:hypothetical protein CRE_09507 [Caenorhabditis remanei]